MNRRLTEGVTTSGTVDPTYGAKITTPLGQAYPKGTRRVLEPSANLRPQSLIGATHPSGETIKWLVFLYILNKKIEQK